MKILSLISSLLVVLACLNSLAQTDVQAAESFKNDIEQFSLVCKATCSNPEYAIVPVYQNPKTIGDLNHRSKLDLIKIANYQAQIWGDTILEGDYHSSGHTSLDVVEKLFYKSKFLGYRISYSEKAWFIGDCEFNPEDTSTLSDCAEGRIRESSYVSPDMKTYFVNEEDYAEFE